MDARPIPSETKIHGELVQLSSDRVNYPAKGHEATRSGMLLYEQQSPLLIAVKRIYSVEQPLPFD